MQTTYFQHFWSAMFGSEILADTGEINVGWRMLKMCSDSTRLGHVKTWKLNWQNKSLFFYTHVTCLKCVVFIWALPVRGRGGYGLARRGPAQMIRSIFPHQNGRILVFGEVINKGTVWELYYPSINFSRYWNGFFQSPGPNTNYDIDELYSNYSIEADNFESSMQRVTSADKDPKSSDLWKR